MKWLNHLLQQLFYQQCISAAYRDVVLTKKVWERSLKTSHFKPASNSF